MRNLKTFESLNDETPINEVKGKKIWVGVMPGAFGYGICAIGDTEKEVRDTMKKAFDEYKEGYKPEGEDFRTFHKAMEYFGGRIEQIEMGKAYNDNFGE